MPDSTKRIKLLGGEIGVTLYGVDERMAELLFPRINDEGLRLQKIFNFFDPKSELSKLNKKRRLKVSDELLEVIKKCLPYCELTQGAYDISKGRQIMERKQGLAVSGVSCSYKDIEIKKNEILLKNKDVLLDLGSAAKGYIGDKLMEFIKGLGVKNAFIDLRGDIIISAAHKRKVGVQHPRVREKTISSFMLKDGAVATSGDYNQYFGDYSKSHILCSKDIISSTVIAGTLLEADILATCIFVSGMQNIGFFSGHKYIVVDKYLNVVSNESS
jgi:thiamine biosynthesis lipoprotein